MLDISTIEDIAAMRESVDVECKLAPLKLLELKFFNSRSRGCWNNPGENKNEEVIGVQEQLVRLSPGEKLVGIQKIFQL